MTTPTESSLPWRVEVECAGGPNVVARFSRESDAWEYAGLFSWARVWLNDEARGEGSHGSWGPAKVP